MTTRSQALNNVLAAPMTRAWRIPEQLRDFCSKYGYTIIRTYTTPGAEDGVGRSNGPHQRALVEKDGVRFRLWYNRNPRTVGGKPRGWQKS